MFSFINVIYIINLVHSLFCAGFLIYSIVNQLHTYTFSVEFAFSPPHFSHLHVFPFLVPCCDDQLFPGKKDIMLVFTPICFVGVFIFVFIYIYWCSTRFLRQMMLVWFNMNTTCATCVLLNL